MLKFLNFQNPKWPTTKNGSPYKERGMLVLASKTSMHMLKFKQKKNNLFMAHSSFSRLNRLLMLQDTYVDGGFKSSNPCFFT